MGMESMPARAAVGAATLGKACALKGWDERSSAAFAPSRGIGVVQRVASRRVGLRLYQPKVWVCEQAFSGSDLAAQSEPPHSGI